MLITALSLLSASNIQALMADEVQALSSADPQDLMDIAVHYGVTPPEVAAEQEAQALDEDFRKGVVLDIARKKVIELLDSVVPLNEPWESASDVLITVAVNEALGALDTPEERQALWNKLQQLWDRIGDNVRARRERRQARRAERAQG